MNQFCQKSAKSWVCDIKFQSITVSIKKIRIIYSFILCYLNPSKFQSSVSFINRTSLNRSMAITHSLRWATTSENYLRNNKRPRSAVTSIHSDSLCFFDSSRPRHCVGIIRPLGSGCIAEEAGWDLSISAIWQSTFLFIRTWNVFLNSYACQLWHGH